MRDIILGREEGVNMRQALKLDRSFRLTTPPSDSKDPGWKSLRFHGWSRVTARGDQLLDGTLTRRAGSHSAGNVAALSEANCQKPKE
jgi:hypothetical protein